MKQNFQLGYMLYSKLQYACDLADFQVDKVVTTKRNCSDFTTTGFCENRWKVFSSALVWKPLLLLMVELSIILAGFKSIVNCKT